jgi:hypothetical protein
MKKYTLLFLMAAFLLGSCATQQNRAERKEQMRKAVAEAVDKRQMHIGINSMETMRYGTRMVSSDFFLELRGDTIRSYLPYLGQAHRAPVTWASQGLDFEAPIKAIEESHPKKDLACLKIEVDTNEDNLLYTVELYDTGKAYIHVRSLHRDPISFDGELEKTQ